MYVCVYNGRSGGSGSIVIATQGSSRFNEFKMEH